MVGSLPAGLNLALAELVWRFRDCLIAWDVPAISNEVDYFYFARLIIKLRWKQTEFVEELLRVGVSMEHRTVKDDFAVESSRN